LEKKKRLTILESSTGSLFIHMTMNEQPNLEWGTILKSNSNGTYFGPSLDYVNRDLTGYVDFEKLVGLAGIAIANVVKDPGKAMLTGYKELKTMITLNDGGSWAAIRPPKKDTLGNEYLCKDVVSFSRSLPHTSFSRRVVYLMISVGLQPPHPRLHRTT
jgi:hypothetical protein